MRAMLIGERYSYDEHGAPCLIPAEYGRDRAGEWEGREPWALAPGDVIRTRVAGVEQIRVVHAITDDGRAPGVLVRLACDDAGELDGLETSWVARRVEVLVES